MDAFFITRAIAKSCLLVDSSLDFCTNIYLRQFESDFLTFTKSGYLTEFEIKISKSDFKCDFSKSVDAWDSQKEESYKINKHEMIKNGIYGLKYFSFVAPVGVLNIQDIPYYAGFYEVDNDCKIWQVKQPVKLKNPKKLTKDEHHSVRNFYKYAWRKLFYKKVNEYGKG